MLKYIQTSKTEGSKPISEYNEALWQKLSEGRRTILNQLADPGLSDDQRKNLRQKLKELQEQASDLHSGEASRQRWLRRQ